MSKNRVARPTRKIDPTDLDLEIRPAKGRGGNSETLIDWEAKAHRLEDQLDAVRVWLANLPLNELPDHQIILAGESLLELHRILKNDETA